MTQIMKKPDIVTDAHLKYLDGLRESGATNMWGAGTYVERSFGISKKDADIILKYWMDSFDIRHHQ